MEYEVFDERRCILGEGPSATGAEYKLITWVDVLGNRVYSRNLETDEKSEIRTSAHVSFAIPRVHGGYVLGLANSPVIYDVEGGLSALPGRMEADGVADPNRIRWNDAKVSPLGELWLGTMTYDLLPGKSALYRMSRDGRMISRVLSDLTVSNGIGWSPDGARMFFVDSPTRRVSVFEVAGSMISNRRIFIDTAEFAGVPDGLAVDSEGGIWVAFWEGAAIRRFDGSDGSLTNEVRFAANRITSCAFGGSSLTQLFVTSARNEDPEEESAEAGMTFVVEAGVQGQPIQGFAG